MPVKILTIDDRNTMRMIIKKAFLPYDCIILEAENGLEGVKMAREEKPDLILLDIEMPVMDGYAALEEMKSDDNLKQIPVIMLTIGASKQKVIKILKLGVEGYLVKPVKIKELIRRVENVITLPSKNNRRVEMLGRYFRRENNALIMNIPPSFTKSQRFQMEEYLPSQLEKMSESKLDGLILNLMDVRSADVQLARMLLKIVEECVQAKVRVRVAGGANVSQKMKELSETSHITVFSKLSDAMETLRPE